MSPNIKLNNFLCFKNITFNYSWTYSNTLSINDQIYLLVKGSGILIFSLSRLLACSPITNAFDTHLHLKHHFLRTTTRLQNPILFSYLTMFFPLFPFIIIKQNQKYLFTAQIVAQGKTWLLRLFKYLVIYYHNVDIFRHLLLPRNL